MVLVLAKIFRVVVLARLVHLKNEKLIEVELKVLHLKLRAQWLVQVGGQKRTRYGIVCSLRSQIFVFESTALESQNVPWGECGTWAHMAVPGVWRSWHRRQSLTFPSSRRMYWCISFCIIFCAPGPPLLFLMLCVYRKWSPYINLWGTRFVSFCLPLYCTSSIFVFRVGTQITGT